MVQHITLQGGRLPAPTASAKSLIFDIDPSQALFMKEGDSLVIQPTGGTPTIIEEFFSSVRSGGDTEFILADGTTLNGKDFFQAYSPNLVTAMGPNAAAPSSSGGGTYDDDAGRLIGGVDRFGAADAVADAPTLRASRLDVPVSQVAGLPNSDPAAGAPVGPQPPADPDCRFVLYGNAADQASWASGIQAVPPANGHTAGIVSVGDGAYGTAQLMPDGSIKYIPAPGVSWPEDGSPLVDRIVITLSDGSTRVIEVLLVDGTTYNAADHTDLGGERHEGLIEGVYTVTATAYDDVFARRTGSVGLAAGSALDMGAGDDTLLIQAAGTSGGAAYGADKSTVRMGEGNDSVAISVSTTGGNAYAVSGGLLDLGSGNDVLQLTASARAGSNASAYAVSGGAKVDLGDGDNAMTISSDSQNRYAYGIYSEINGPRSSVVAGNGNDTLRINVQPGSYGAAVANSLINLGDGDNLIALNVRGTSGAGLYGIDRSEVVTGSGNDTLAITMTGGYGINSGIVKMGDGDNLLNVTGADAAISGSVVMGSGNDSLLIDGTGSSGSASKYGIFGYTGVYMGAGDDLVKINLLSGSSAEALRTGTLDMGAGNDTVSFQVTATGYSAGGLNDSARLLMGAGDDLLTISVSARNYGSLAFGMHNNSLVDLGDGNDTMRVDVTTDTRASNTYAYGMASGRIAAGNGNDDVRLRASASTSAATGTAEADGVNSAAIDMGAGDDTLTIEAAASGANAIARGIYALYYQNNTVDGGAGNDSIQLSATASGTLSSLAVGVGNATLLAGAGDDTLDVSILATGGNAVAMGLQQAVVNLGDGNDVARFDVRSDGDAYGLSDGTNGFKVTGGSVLDLGGGNDSLSIDVRAGHDAYGIHKSTLLAGDGNDRVSITVDGAAGSWGVFGSQIDMGGGHDYLSITAGATGRGTAVEGSSIDLGTGNDTLEIAGAVHNATVLAGLGKDMLHIDGAVIGASLIDAGADDDLIILGANFSLDGQARITGGTGIDVLKFDAGMDFFDFTAHTGQLTGLEYLDLTDGAHEIVLGLDDILALTNDASGAGMGEALRIRGDADDAVRLTGSGWNIDAGNPVTLTEPDGSSRTYYAASNGATTVYIDEQIRLDMLSITG